MNTDGSHNKYTIYQPWPHQPNPFFQDRPINTTLHEHPYFRGQFRNERLEALSDCHLLRHLASLATDSPFSRRSSTCPWLSLEDLPEFEAFVRSYVYALVL